MLTFAKKEMLQSETEEYLNVFKGNTLFLQTLCRTCLNIFKGYKRLIVNILFMYKYFI